MTVRYRFCVDVVDVGDELTAKDLAAIQESLGVSVKIELPKKARKSRVEVIHYHDHSGSACGGCAAHYSDGRGHS